MNKRLLLPIILLLGAFGAVVATRGLADEQPRGGEDEFARGYDVVMARSAAAPLIRRWDRPIVSSLSPNYSIFDATGALVFSLTAEEAAGIPPVARPVIDCPYPDIWQAFRTQGGPAFKPGRYTLAVNWKQRHVVSEGIHECVITEAHLLR
jgi:hypothetical protein